MELLTSFLVIVILATTSAKPAGWHRHHDADIADEDLSTLLEMHAVAMMRSSESWQSSQSSESESSESNTSSQQDSSDSSESREDDSDSSEESSKSSEDDSDSSGESSKSSEEDDSESSEESSEEVIIVTPPVPTTPGQESPSTAATPTVDAVMTTATPVPERMSTSGPTALPLTPHVTLPGDLTPCVTHDIVTPTERRGDN